MSERVASLSLDLDNQWCFMQTNGDAGWDSFPSYLSAFVPRILEFFASRDLQITFFIVGQDAALPVNREPLQAIAKAGHEIGSHSFLHQPWLHEYSSEELDLELKRAEDAIEEATGQRPTAFRGPGYSYSKDVLEVLQRRGYRFDCSSFPNSLSSLARIYFFRGSGIGKDGRRQRKGLFGRPSEMLKPLKPYYWRLQHGDLLEIPVSTMPLFRLPIHFSYVLYLSRFSRTLALAYFKTAMLLCRITGLNPSLLFHPLDFIGVDDGCTELAFFPGMDIPGEQKIATMHRCLDILEKYFRPVSMGTHAALVEQRSAVVKRA